MPTFANRRHHHQHHYTNGELAPELAPPHARTRVRTHAKRTTDQTQSCWSCYYLGSRCSQCHFSTKDNYYLNYYADYYADYYCDYYANYYSNAALQYQLAQNDPTPNNVFV